MRLPEVVVTLPHPSAGIAVGAASVQVDADRGRAMTLTTIPRGNLALLDVVDDMLRYARQGLAKAATPAAVQRHDKLIAENHEAFTADVAEYFVAFAERALPAVKKAIAVEWDPARDIDWTVEADELAKVLLRWYIRLGEAAFEAVSELLGVEIRWDLNERNVKAVLARIATQIKGINEASRDMLRVRLEAGISRGLSIDEIVRGTDGFAGIRGLVESWASTLAEGAASRAQTIALTESANAFNAATIAGYRSSGLIDEVQVLDGVKDDACAAANGSIWTLDKADANLIQHPHCQRAFTPVVAR